MSKKPNKGFANPHNQLSKELNNASYKSKIYHNSMQFWYQDYVNSPAQYQMNFADYKKLRKNKRKYEKWLRENTK